MEEKKFWENNKTLLVLFGFSVFLMILFSAISCRGLFFRIPTNFLSVLEKEFSSSFYLFQHVFEPNNFSNRLLALPYNILFPIFGENPLMKLNLYTFSCMLSIFLATMFNFVIAKRTKKFEIAALALLFYALFTIPSSCLPTEPTYLAIPIFFIYLQYFLCEEKLYKFDYLLIVLISGYLFQSCSTMIIPTVILFLTGLIMFLKGHVKHWKIKLFISLSSIFAAMYMIYRIFFAVNENGNTTLHEAFLSFQNSLATVFGNFFTSEMMFSAIAVLFIGYGLLKRKFLGKREAVFASIITMFALYSIFEFTKFQPQLFVNIEYYSVATIAFITVIISISLIAVTRKNFNYEKLYDNLLKTACVCGILQCLIQYGNCINALEYKTFLTNKVTETSGIAAIEEVDYKTKPFLAMDFCDNSIIRSLYVSPKNVQTVIIPNQKRIEENKSCLGYNEFDHASDEENAYIIIQSSYFPLKNQHWNLNEIIPLLENFK